MKPESVKLLCGTVLLVQKILITFKFQSSNSFLESISLIYFNQGILIQYYNSFCISNLCIRITVWFIIKTK